MLLAQLEWAKDECGQWKQLVGVRRYVTASGVMYDVDEWNTQVSK